MNMFPDYIYNGEAYRMLAFSQDEFESAIYSAFNVNDAIIISSDDINKLANTLINKNDDYVSWTKDVEKHNDFHDFYRDFNGDNYYLFSIKSNVTGFYITKFNQYLYENLFNKSKEEYDKESLKFDGVNYSDQDEIIAPTNYFELNMINQISINDLIGLNFIDFLNKINNK